MNILGLLRRAVARYTELHASLGKALFSASKGGAKTGKKLAKKKRAPSGLRGVDVKDRVYLQGKKGGRYYIGANGKKVYG